MKQQRTAKTHAAGLIACSLALFASSTGRTESGRFHHGASYDASDIELHVASALDRGDGHWLVLGSRLLSDNREATYLSLRSLGGRFVRAIGFDPGQGRSWSPRSAIVTGSGEVIVVGIDYDAADFKAPQRLFALRVDAGLEIRWARSLRVPESSIAQVIARLDGERVVLLGTVQPMAGGIAGPGDAFVADLDGGSGAVSAARAIGTPDDDERGVDVGFSGGERVLLLEVPRGPARAQPADGIVGLSSEGALTAAHLSGHAINPPIRATALRLWPATDGWTIAGRRSVFGPNVFYLQHVAADLVPDDARTLVPFFNVSDMLPRADGGARLLGGANDERSDRGTVLLDVDDRFGIRAQQRFGTQTLSFPTGAIAHGDGGLLIAFGGVRESDARVFESVDRIDAHTHESLLCDQGTYSGFSTAIDSAVDAGAWQPALASMDLVSDDIDPAVEALEPETIAECTRTEELIFRDGIEARIPDVARASNGCT